MPPPVPQILINLSNIRVTNSNNRFLRRLEPNHPAGNLLTLTLNNHHTLSQITQPPNQFRTAISLRSNKLRLRISRRFHNNSSSSSSSSNNSQCSRRSHN